MSRLSTDLMVRFLCRFSSNARLLEKHSGHGGFGGEPEEDTLNLRFSYGQPARPLLRGRRLHRPGACLCPPRRDPLLTVVTESFFGTISILRAMHSEFYPVIR